MALLAGCASGENGLNDVVLGADEGTRSVEISVLAEGDGLKYVILVVTYPGGQQVVPTAAMLRDGYLTWFGTDLPTGTYSFSEYWVPAEEARDLTISVDDVIDNGNACAGGEFTID